VKSTFAHTAYELLLLAERVYLEANGWIQKGDGSWKPPPGYPEPNKKRWQSHAVASQKLRLNQREPTHYHHLRQWPPPMNNDETVRLCQAWVPDSTGFSRGYPRRADFVTYSTYNFNEMRRSYSWRFLCEQHAHEQREYLRISEWAALEAERHLSNEEEDAFIQRLFGVAALAKRGLPKEPRAFWLGEDLRKFLWPEKTNFWIQGQAADWTFELDVVRTGRLKC